MRYTITSTVAFAAAVVAQGVTEQKKPDSSAPSGCSPSYDGEFEISVANVTSSNSKRSVEKRQQAEADKLLIKLQDGVLTDSENRTGYIAANHQFQFDGPAQTGAIYTAGWSVCENGSLALGGEAVFYQCLTGNPTGPGSFYNLYDESQGEQCGDVTINISGASSSSSSSGTEQIDDGQPQAATSATPAASVGQINDGQPQAATSAATSSAASVGQIDDGQVQAATSATGAPVSQIDDGQVQAPTGTPASQIPDGQVQAPYPANNATAPAPSGTGSPQTPAPFEGAATQAYTAGAAAVVALLGFVAAL